MARPYTPAQIAKHAESDEFARVVLAVYRELAAEAAQAPHRTLDSVPTPVDVARNHEELQDRIQARWAEFKASRDSCGTCQRIHAVVGDWITNIKKFYSTEE